MRRAIDAVAFWFALGAGFLVALVAHVAMALPRAYREARAASRMFRPRWGRRDPVVPPRESPADRARRLGLGGFRGPAPVLGRDVRIVKGGKP